MMKSSFWLFLVFSIIAAPLISQKAVYGKAESNIQKKKLKLENVTEKIRKHRKKLKKVELKETRVIARLNRIEKQLLKDSRDYKKLNNKIERIQKDIRLAHSKIESLQKQTDKSHVDMQKRLRSLYKYYRRSGLTILLSADSYNNFLRQEKLFGEIVSDDYELFSKCLKTLEEKKQYEIKLNKKRDELLKTKSSLLEKRNSIKDSQEKKLALLKKIKHEKSLHLKALNELEKHSKELQAFIDHLPRNKQTFKSLRKKFSSMKGKLMFPVRGKIISWFGKREHPDLHTFTFQKGVEIEASEGTEIKAVYDGKVIFADWFKGFGYMIIIDHGENYYSLSAHASKLFKNVGEFVSEGETVALVGDTSSIKGSCLYFEIRYHGKPKNPLKWLKKGGNKT